MQIGGDLSVNTHLTPVIHIILDYGGSPNGAEPAQETLPRQPTYQRFDALRKISYMMITRTKMVAPMAIPAIAPPLRDEDDIDDMSMSIARLAKPITCAATK